MKITILLTGDVPPALSARFEPYPEMFARMFARAGAPFAFETIPINHGAPFPNPGALDAVIVPGSTAGVYDDLPWIEPLRAFIRAAYAARTPMLGICFGHQVIADALGGDVRKSEKGWGMGRHTYAVKGAPAVLAGAPDSLSVICSHQDQVIVPPAEAEVILSSDFTPNAGLTYANGRTLTFQPHPEFDDDYAIALAEMRRGLAPDAVIETALASLAATPSHAPEVAGYITAFLLAAEAGRPAPAMAAG